MKMENGDTKGSDGNMMDLDPFALSVIEAKEFDPQLISRDEKNQTEAMIEFYEKNDGSDQPLKLKIAMFAASWVIPFAVVVFCVIYWTAGIMKYSSG